jgi:type I restriction enzyme R subunit
MSQFTFLSSEFADVYSLAVQAESHARTDARAASVYARLALETIVNWLYRFERSLKDPYERTLAARIHEATFQKLVGPPLVAKARLIKDLGNRAAHEARAVPAADAVSAVRELFHVSYWLVRTYAKGAKPDPALRFSPQALPQNAAVPVQTLAQLKEAAKRFADAVKAREDAEALRLASETERARLEAEIETLKAEVAQARAANTAVPDAHDYDEAATRDKFIDVLLAEAGWTFTRPGSDTEFPVTGMPNESGQGFVDYVLWGDDGKPLGLAEAKRARKDPRVGQQQAKLYADCLEQQFGQRPVIFYTNGYDHWIWDDTRYPPRPIQGFLTKDELQLAIWRRTARTQLDAGSINPAIVERPYQVRAIRRVAETYETDNLRRALLVMATGAGKTRTVIALADLLMRANWVRRVLFLADRVALVKQAVNAFKKFLPDASPVNLVTDRDATGRVYVATYPTMMGLIDEAREGKKQFGPGHFDLVVIDEAHRSVYRKYGAIFDYFDSLLVGLTATPKDEVDRDTYRLFNLQRGVPTDAYGLDDAVNDGYLVPPRAVSLTTDFMDRGLSYDRLSDEEKEDWDATEWDEDGAVPARVEPAAVNKCNKDTVDKVLEHLMTGGLKVADGDRIGKTIIFAKNHDHAKFIVDRFDENYPHLKGFFARLVDFQVTYAQTLIDDFSIADKAPHITVSVDMLDTGIDVPEVVNLVFFKVVRSKTKFWQMLGRGTRLCPDLFGTGRHKEFFYVFDWCRNFEFFNQNPVVADAPVGESLAKKLFVSRVELIGELDKKDKKEDAAEAQHGEYTQLPTRVLHVGEAGSAVDLEAEHRNLRKDVAARLCEEVAGMSLDNFIVRPRRRLVEKYAKPDAWKALGLDEQTELRDEVAGLPSGLVDDDLAAKEFDLLILKTQLAVLRADHAFDGLQRKIREIAGLLEEISNVPMVERELELIQEIQTDAFWQDVTVPMLETVRRRLRDLIKLIEVKRRPPVYTDFEDDVGAATQIDVNGLGAVADMARFRAKARHFLQANENHIAIIKLRRNEPLTATDLAELERLFVEAGASPAELETAKAGGGLGLFIRDLVGLDREAAKRAFAGFLTGRTLSSNQIEFIDMIIDHLTARGVMDARLLYEPPFTYVNPMGLNGVFQKPDDAANVVSILGDVRRRATPERPGDPGYAVG